MADPIPDGQDVQSIQASEQFPTEPAVNSTSVDVEMSEDAVPLQPTLPIFTNTADSSFTIAPADALTSAAEQPVSIPIASTATPLAAVASPGPTQPTAPAPRTSSLPPSTPSAGATLAPPPAPSPHGSPTRVYLNQNVTPHLLEGMKYLAVYEPEKPLKWLADFLGERSREIEGA